MTATPWLAETPWPTRQLDRAELEKAYRAFSGDPLDGRARLHQQQWPDRNAGRVSRRRTCTVCTAAAEQPQGSGDAERSAHLFCNLRREQRLGQRARRATVCAGKVYRAGHARTRSRDDDLPLAGIIRTTRPRTRQAAAGTLADDRSGANCLHGTMVTERRLCAPPDLASRSGEKGGDAEVRALILPVTDRCIFLINLRSNLLKGKPPSRIAFLPNIKFSGSQPLPMVWFLL